MLLTTKEPLEPSQLEASQNELHKLIEQMDQNQAELVLSFIKTLFGLSD